ncbi:MAG TPA: type II toxin-antitoxin system RelE/ParE family toxin [Gemmataceae bacterium]|nr:type II toxin-antitoxin system RelE/ParE family toxin [Gemmataceae bacterium]
MIFTVTWSEWAQQQLAAVWLASSNRDAVTQASHYIDLTLRVDPDTVGRRHLGNIRRFRHSPLGVLFEVNELDRIVTVLAVWEVTSPTS